MKLSKLSTPDETGFLLSWRSIPLRNVLAAIGVLLARALFIGAVLLAIHYVPQLLAKL